MKKQILLPMLLFGFCLIFVHAADDTDKSAEEGTSGTDNESTGTSDAEDPNDPFRIKRDGGHNNAFSGILSSVFNKKIGLIGSLSSVSSSSSSKSNGDSHQNYDYNPPAPKFDWYGFKRTILASLLQAVKAITGGVIALNGQLVKVKGHLLAAKAHLLATKGDSITAFGRHIVTHAFSTPHHDTAHTDAHDAAPSAPASAPSGFGASGPAGVQSALEHGYPSHGFKAGIEYPTGYFKDPTGYAKRAAPMYYIVQDDTLAKASAKNS